ncbi:MAG: TIR domain-containing protein [Chitinophagaceae bacterium]
MKIFISHSWNDKSLATQINETLEKDGHEAWYDIHQLVPGDDIQAVIDVYIKKCDAVILLWSLHAFDSAGVDAEIQTTKKLGKRIIPLLKDSTPLAHHKELKGLLGIPFDDVETGMLLLQRALLMLMAGDTYKDAPWFKEAFDNVVDLGGYLNYVNTYRLKGSKNDDGYKEQWAARLEELNKKNELIRKHLLPEAENKMETLQGIMKELEKGNTPIEKLNEWKQWCAANESFQPELMKKLKEFIDNDIQRLHNGGAPVSTLNIESVEKIIRQLENAIDQKKEAAHHDLTATIKKYGGFLMGEKTVNSIVTSYLNYVTKCPQLLRELLNEAKLSEYVAVKEAVVMLTRYLASQDHGLEMRKKNLEGYFDDAYLVNHTVKLLIEADLVAKESFSLDFVSTKVVEQYVSFILNKQTKIKLDDVLKEMRNLIGLKKNEINWGQVAAVVIGIAAVGSGAGYLGGLQANPGLQAGAGTDGSTRTGEANDSACWEDRMSAMSAKYGGGINFYHPIKY